MPEEDVTPRTRFVLVNTSHGGNVGAAARAMKVMGFDDLVLVNPRFADVLSREDTVAMASGAADVLARARIVDTLVEALHGVTLACATAMTARDFGPPTAAPRAYFDGLGVSAHTVGLVFGSERFGLANDDVYRCHVCLRIPTAPGYGSLNLAQAVQLVAYERRLALGGFDAEPACAPAQTADVAAIEGALAHWRQVLVDIDFLDPATPRKLMPRLQQLVNRAQPTRQELDILRGIARAVARASAAK